MLIAKLALGVASTVGMAGVYTFHQGLVRVEVDEGRSGGAHVHLWAPAAMVPVVLRFASKHQVEHAAEKLQPMMPAIRELAKQLQSYPNAEFIDVVDGLDHVQIGTRDGSLEINVHDKDDTVHVTCPLSTLEDLSRQIEDDIPAA